jgi:hypothetical protein
MHTRSDSQTEDFLSFDEFEQALANDDGEAAQQHLAAGRAIYYSDERYPEGIVKKYPEGRLQLVTIGPNYVVTIIWDL